MPSPNPFRTTLLVTLAGASLFLLYGDVVMILRVGDGGGGHVGSDIVFGFYAFSAFCLAAGAALACFTLRGRLRWLRTVLTTLAVCAATTWFLLHGSGVIYSHESMVEHRHRPLPPPLPPAPPRAAPQP